MSDSPTYQHLQFRYWKVIGQCYARLSKGHCVGHSTADQVIRIFSTAHRAVDKCAGPSSRLVTGS
jgi:hypothetical protein